MIVTRRALAAALSLAALAGLASPPVGRARAQSAVAPLLAKPVSLPDMALGSAKAAVTIYEYASMSCPHCAAFEENVFPMLKSKYIDSGKLRFVFREFPLDIKAAAASMLARCIAGDDATKYFDAVEQLFKMQEQLMADPELRRKMGEAARRASSRYSRHEFKRRMSDLLRPMLADARRGAPS